MTDRRQFLEALGTSLGLVVAGQGAFAKSSLGFDLLARAERLRFGPLDELVDLLQSTAADSLLPELVRQLRSGLALPDLVAATALANARALGGTHYIGYHALMALMPSYEMSQQLSGPLAALPVLKVVHRNARSIQDGNAANRDTLKPITPGAEGSMTALLDEEALAAGERRLARRSEQGILSAYEEIQEVVRHDIDVHRVVLSWRAYDLLRLTGEQQATTMLRQELRYCADSDRSREESGRGKPEVAALVPELMQRHDLAGKERGKKVLEEREIEEFSDYLLTSDRAESAERMAELLARGSDPADLSRALSRTTALIVLRDRGQQREAPGKPVGSVHGANYGVHSADSANAWRHIAALGSGTHAHATLIAAAYHIGGHKPDILPALFDEGSAAPTEEKSAERLLSRLETALRERDQRTACAVTRRYNGLQHSPEAFFKLMLSTMVEQDGALHAEKYFRTVQEEFADARPAHRDLQLLALARVAASGYGYPAPGLEEARELLQT